MDYLDFHLKIGAPVAEGQYPVSSRSPTSGETNGVFARPLTDEQLELFVLKVGLARRSVRRIHSPEWRAAQDFGQKLFRALFTEEIRAAYVASHNDAVRQGKGLRIHLTLDAPELANYPWEFLYDPANSQFLSLFEDTPILRYIELSRPVLPLTVTPPLRILAVASSPKDYELLDLARERRNLTRALEPLINAGLFELDWLPTATLEAVREQLVKRPYHIFHFIGHGGFDERQQDGVLLFENAAQYSNRVSGERLAIILGNHRTLRLAVLNACEGARTSEQDPFAGTAMTLVRTGNLPAVIAMQFEITDAAAINFASGFYSALAVGRPVDAAVSQGRQAIFADDNDVEWSTPVLYLRAPDGMIFNITTATADQEGKRIAEEQKRLAQAIAEIDRAAAQAEIDRREKLRLEQERLAQEKTEQDRLAAAQAENEHKEKARLEQERLAQEQAEQERLAREKLAEKRIASEQAFQKKREDERLAQERLAQEKLQAERAALQQAERTPARANTFPPPPNFSPEAKTAAPRQSVPAPEPVAPTFSQRLANLPLPAVLFASLIFLSLSTGFGVASPLAFSKSSDEFPNMQLAAILLFVLGLACGIIGSVLVGRAIARQAQFDTQSVVILALGWTVGILLVPSLLNISTALLGRVALIGIVTSGFATLALRSANPNLTRNVMFIVAAGWVIGFVLQGAVLDPALQSAASSIWDWLAPIYNTFPSYEAVILLQVGIVGSLLGWIGPAFGIAAMVWQLRAPQK